MLELQVLAHTMRLNSDPCMSRPAPQRPMTVIHSLVNARPFLVSTSQSLTAATIGFSLFVTRTQLLPDGDYAGIRCVRRQS